MFTVRAESHRGEYSVYSCETYFVGDLASSEHGNGRCVGLTETNDHLEPAFMTFDVGDEMPYSAVYVTNQSGNTVDTIRAPNNPREGTPK